MHLCRNRGGFRFVRKFDMRPVKMSLFFFKIILAAQCTCDLLRMGSVSSPP